MMMTMVEMQLPSKKSFVEIRNTKLQDITVDVDRFDRRLGNQSLSRLYGSWLVAIVNQTASLELKLF
jgi:hypothetical protein